MNRQVCTSLFVIFALLAAPVEASPQRQRDCNRNGVADATDIASGASQDRNGNGVPDECERAPVTAPSGPTSNVVGVAPQQPQAPALDAAYLTVPWDCNANGISDAQDLSSGTSTDCNANGRPDECEIAAGASLDTNSNGIPDECEPVANQDAYVAAMDTVLNVNALLGVLANDSDTNMDPLTAVLFSDVTSGALMLASDGSFSYTPAAGFYGFDSFRYQASDGMSLSADALVTISVNPSTASGFLVPPPPGSIYKEFTRIMSTAGSDWRVTDPSATNPGTPGNNPGTYLPNNVLPLTIDDLTGALRAEAVIDLWGGHVGTTSKQLILNGNAPITIPELVSTPTAGECYVQQPNIAVEIPLGYLTLGTNFIQGDSGGQTCHNANWGQWGWYAITVRVYYDESHPHPTGTVTSPIAGSSFDEDPIVTADAASPLGISKVEFFAYYDGYDTDGDGRYVDYHYNRHRALNDSHMNARDHVGTDLAAPYAVTWDTELVPDQDPASMRILARIRDTDGTWYVTPEVTGLSLARTLHSVELFRPTNVPELYWSNLGNIKSSDFEVPPGGLDDIVSAKLLIKTWNGVDGQTEPGDTSFRAVNSWIMPVFGGNHFYSYDVIDVPPTELFVGTNSFTLQATTIHHGIEVMWPGPGMLVRRDLPPAAPTGLSAQALGGGNVQLEWDDHPSASVDRFHVYQGLAPGFALDGTTRIASDVPASSFLATGLPQLTMLYFVVTAVHVAGPESPASNEVSVMTMADTTGPSLISASASIATTVVCLFDESLDVASAENASNYALSSMGGNPLVLSAVLGLDQRSVTLTTEALTENEAYTLTANGVLDLALPANASNTQAAFMFTGGLLAHYPFDEGSGATTADAQGGPDGLLADPLWSATSADGSPQSLHFDGTDDLVDLGAPEMSGNALSLSLWFNADDFDVSDARLLSKAVGVQENEHHWMISTVFTEGETRLRFRVKAGAETSTLIASSGALTAGLWTHVTATYDGVTMRLYKDGVLVGSRIKSGDLDPGVGVGLAVGNQPDGAGARPFDGFIDDVRVFERGLAFGEIQVLAGTGIPAMTGAPPVIDVWYGPTQRFGHLGLPQSFVNVLGKVTDVDNAVVSLRYTLNGGAPIGMGIGPDTRRLQDVGDFNVDVPYASLLPLPLVNTVLITAEDAVGNLTLSLVTVEYTAGVAWPDSYVVDWDSGASLEDVGQVVDGLWDVQGGKAVTIETGYDRLIALGDVAHDNYEVTVPVTVHSIDANGFPPPSVGPLVGIGLRWPGHSDSTLLPGFFVPGPAQPMWGYFPAGGLCWYHWTDPNDPTVGEFAVTENYFTGTSSLPGVFVMDDEYMFKARVTTLIDNSPRIQFKYWRPSIETEPGVWYLQRDGAPGDPMNGGLLLLAHHADLEFGDVVVTALP